LRWTQILGRVLRTEDDLEWDLQTAHFFQYDDGIEFIDGEDGEQVANSVNIKLFAESLMEERWVTLETQDTKKSKRKKPPGEGDRFVHFTVETDQATGINTEQIYEGVRHNNEGLKLYKILAARLRMPEVKIAALIEKGGEDEWRRALEGDQ
jgi:hypothetical protein